MFTLEYFTTIPDNKVLNFTYCIYITADGQKEVFVASYDDITARIDEGTVNRWRKRDRDRQKIIERDGRFYGVVER